MALIRGDGVTGEVAVDGSNRHRGMVELQTFSDAEWSNE